MLCVDKILPPNGKSVPQNLPKGSDAEVRPSCNYKKVVLIESVQEMSKNNLNII